jgi:DNA-binding NarL/FixJ family response regulator
MAVGEEPMGSGIRAVRVLVVDDHQVFADALAARLAAEPDLEVVGVAHSGADAEHLARRHAPDLVILDIDLGDANGLELAPRLLDGYPERRIVVATAHDSPEVATRSIRAGVRGFVSKDSGFDDLLRAVRGVMRGETWIPPRLLTSVLNDLRDQGDRNREFEDLMRLLTPRERDVLACMVSGLDRASVARELGLSIDTVRTHTQNMFAKLNVHSVLEAVGLAVRAGVGSSRSGESSLPVSRGREA